MQSGKAQEKNVIEKEMRKVTKERTQLKNKVDSLEKAN